MRYACGSLGLTGGWMFVYLNFMDSHQHCASGEAYFISFYGCYGIPPLTFPDPCLAISEGGGGVPRSIDLIWVLRWYEVGE